MCVRYVFKMGSLDPEATGRIDDWPKAHRYNVAPTQPVPIIRNVQGKRIATQVRWGMIPYFARGRAAPYPTINARMETMEVQSSYRAAWRRNQRCLQLASGFYEWHSTEDREAPFFIHLTDQDDFSFASLWDRSTTDDGEAFESCAIITMDANSLMRHIHNTGAIPHRMPAILAAEDCKTWLTGTPDEARAVLKPYPANMMRAHEVSSQVNSELTQGSDLIAPVA